MADRAVGYWVERRRAWDPSFSDESIDPFLVANLLGPHRPGENPARTTAVCARNSDSHRGASEPLPVAAGVRPSWRPSPRSRHQGTATVRSDTPFTRIAIRATAEADSTTERVEHLIEGGGGKDPRRPEGDVGGRVEIAPAGSGRPLLVLFALDEKGLDQNRL